MSRILIAPGLVPQFLSALLRQRIGAILQSPACQRIDFYLDGVRIDGLGFTLVALADIRFRPGRLKTRATTDEAAAYVAGALFHIFETTPIGGRVRQPYWARTASHFRKVHEIAASIWKQPGIAIDPADVAELRQAILAQPIYQPLIANPHLSYANDGVDV